MSQFIEREKIKAKFVNEAAKVEMWLRVAKRALQVAKTEPKQEAARSRIHALLRRKTRLINSIEYIEKQIAKGIK